MELVYVENTDPFVNFVGGIPTYIRNASSHLEARNIKTHFIGSILDNGIYEKSTFKSITSLSNKKIGHLKFLVLLFKNLGKITLPNDAIIHSQRIILCLPFILSSKKYKIVCTSHGNENEKFMRKRSKLAWILYSCIERFVIPRINLLIVVDQITENYFKRKYPKDIQKIKRIPIGIDLERFKPMDKYLSRMKFSLPIHNKIVLFIGRIEFEKNVQLLINSFKILTSINKEAYLVIAGEGSLLNEYKMYCSKERIHAVNFLGSIDYELIPALINASDVLALTSYFEGSPTVIKEALACNVPVVSTNCGDVKEVIDGFACSHIADSIDHEFARTLNLTFSQKRPYDYHDKLHKYSNTQLFDVMISMINQC